MKQSGFVLAIVALAAVGVVAAPRASLAQVDVNIRVKVPLPPLPRFVFPAPPTVVVVPETYVYTVPDAEVDIVFYHGYWYRPHSGRWYRASSYNGPWGLLAVKQVPSTFKRLPPEFKSVKPVHEPVPYQQVKKNWKQWERERYWDSSQNRRIEHGRNEGPQQHEEDVRGPGKGKGHKK